MSEDKEEMMPASYVRALMDKIAQQAGSLMEEVSYHRKMEQRAVALLTEYERLLAAIEEIANNCTRPDDVQAIGQLVRQARATKERIVRGEPEASS
jgi:hypothetical protein